jgi:hypothetical protein
MRCDFTFRTEMFGKFPHSERPHQGFNCDVNIPYKMTCTITPTMAQYFVNGDLYATAFYSENEVPQKGYFGFGIYSANEEKTI